MPSFTPAEMDSYLSRLGARRAPAAGFESLEVLEAPLQGDEIKERVQQSEETLRKLLEQYFGPDPAREEQVKKLLQQGGEGLRMLADRDAEGLGSNEAAAEGLEAIVRTDGSRPSFLIVEGGIDFQSSPVGGWGPRLTAQADTLRKAASRVGRIETGESKYMGTGFLVGADVVLTNRHVLQLIAKPHDGGWKLHEDAAIDFGREYNGPAAQGRRTFGRRKLKSVVFWGAKNIDFRAPIDHAKLDLALIELAPLPGDDSDPFVVQAAPPAQFPGRRIVTVGYPGEPAFNAYPLTLLDELFKRSFGCKRLAPGETISSAASQQPWMQAHDATTLGGNSGSVVFALDEAGAALGLHYGGRSAAPAENWSHRLDLVLGETNGSSPALLSDVLKKYGVKLSTDAPAAPVPASAAAAPSTAFQGPVKFKDMIQLGGSGGVEAPGDGETSAAEFEGRRGYDPNFIPGFPIPMPAARGLLAEEMRKLKDGSGVELKYEHFSVIMSKSRKMPMLTACNIDGSQSRSLPRLNRWNYDGRLERAHQWGNELYQGRDNPLDRGHMVRREDPVWGTPEVAAQANADTFHYTNSCPQMGVVNQQTWLGLENYILRHVRQDQMRVSVFTGPFFTPDDVEYRGGRIPLSFWKIVAFLLPDGRPSATAYRIGQERELQDLEFVFGAYRTFQISVRQVMDGAGLDFSALQQFDGFSHEEATTNHPVERRIDRLDQILV